MFVIVHSSHGSSWFEVETSSIKANSLANQTDELVWRRISFILETDHYRLMNTRSPNCVHQSESILEQLFSFYYCHLQLVFVPLPYFLRPLKHERGSCFVSPCVGPLGSPNLALHKLKNVVFLCYAIDCNIHTVFILFLPWKFVSLHQYLWCYPNKIALLLYFFRKINGRVSLNFPHLFPSSVTVVILGYLLLATIFFLNKLVYLCHFIFFEIFDLILWNPLLSFFAVDDKYAIWAWLNLFLKVGHPARHGNWFFEKLSHGWSLWSWRYHFNHLQY